MHFDFLQSVFAETASVHFDFSQSAFVETASVHFSLVHAVFSQFEFFSHAVVETGCVLQGVLPQAATFASARSCGSTSRSRTGRFRAIERGSTSRSSTSTTERSHLRGTESQMAGPSRERSEPVPEADELEQAAPVHDEGEEPEPPPELPDDAPEGDALEQATPVPDDDEDAPR